MKRLRAIIAIAACLGVFAPTVASAADPFQQVHKEGTGQISVGFGSSGIFLLNTFRLGFTNGDHKVRKMELTTTASGVTAAFTDHNADDPIVFEGRYGKHTAPAKTHTVTASCSGACTVPIAAKPAGSGWGLALRGFKLERTSGDSNVRKVEIRPTADRKSYRVEFRDNGTFPFRVTIQYAWISLTKTPVQTTAQGQRSAGKTNAVIPLSSVSASSPSVLQGFSFEFLNGDHHLRDMAILQNAQRQYSVRFNDNNYDDPVRAKIDILFWH